jgi:hypothetical protein
MIAGLLVSKRGFKFMMTPLQEWFFMNVEGNVPKPHICREDFDYEFGLITDRLNKKVHDHLRNSIFRQGGPSYQDGEIAQALFNEVVEHVRGGLLAAKAEEEMFDIKLEALNVLDSSCCLIEAIHLGPLDDDY